jgi:hypothetical protein
MRTIEQLFFAARTRTSFLRAETNLHPIGKEEEGTLPS